MKEKRIDRKSTGKIFEVIARSVVEDTRIFATGFFHNKYSFKGIN